MKKIFFFICCFFSIDLFGINLFWNRKSGHGVTADEWLACAVSHSDPNEVYGGLGPYSARSIDHAKDALEGGANPNMKDENNNHLIVGADLAFVKLLLEYGADSHIDNDAALRCIEKTKPKDYEAIKALLMGGASESLSFVIESAKGRMVKISCIYGDLLKQEDSSVIVNAANQRLLGGSGIDGAIHQAAGKDLCNYIEKHKEEITPGIRLAIGDAYLTPAFGLKSHCLKWIVHTVGPDCRLIKDSFTRQELLSKAYVSSIQAAEKKLKKQDSFLKRKLAFPSISTGIYAYPLEEASSIAIKAVVDYVKSHDCACDEIRFVLFSKKDYSAYEDALKNKIKEERAKFKNA